MPSEQLNRKCEFLSNCRAGPHVPLAGAPHAAAERAPSAEHLVATACGVPAEYPPSELLFVSTRCPHAAASSPALTLPFPRSLPAPQVPAQQGLDVADLLVHEPLAA